MEIVSVKCPNCGGYLAIDFQTMTAQCDYCGSKFLVNSEKADAPRISGQTNMAADAIKLSPWQEKSKAEKKSVPWQRKSQAEGESTSQFVYQTAPQPGHKFQAQTSAKTSSTTSSASHSGENKNSKSSSVFDRFRAQWNSRKQAAEESASNQPVIPNETASEKRTSSVILIFVVAVLGVVVLLITTIFGVYNTTNMTEIVNDAHPAASASASTSASSSKTAHEEFVDHRWEDAYKWKRDDSPNITLGLGFDTNFSKRKSIPGVSIGYSSDWYGNYGSDYLITANTDKLRPKNGNLQANGKAVIRIATYTEHQLDDPEEFLRTYAPPTENALLEKIQKTDSWSEDGIDWEAYTAVCNIDKDGQYGIYPTYTDMWCVYIIGDAGNRKSILLDFSLAGTSASLDLAQEECGDCLRQVFDSMKCEPSKITKDYDTELKLAEEKMRKKYGGTGTNGSSGKSTGQLPDIYADEMAQYDDPDSFALDYFDSGDFDDYQDAYDYWVEHHEQ